MQIPPKAIAAYLLRLPRLELNRSKIVISIFVAWKSTPQIPISPRINMQISTCLSSLLDDFLIFGVISSENKITISWYVLIYDFIVDWWVLLINPAITFAYPNNDLSVTWPMSTLISYYSFVFLSLQRIFSTEIMLCTTFSPRNSDGRRLNTFSMIKLIFWGSWVFRF